MKFSVLLRHKPRLNQAFQAIGFFGIAQIIKILKFGAVGRGAAFEKLIENPKREPPVGRGPERQKGQAINTVKRKSQYR